jgi:hypothetical protein
MRPTRNVAVETAEASAAAQAMLEKQGLALPLQPVDPIPPVPDSLSELGDGPLMELFAQLTAWAGFLGAQLAAAEIDERAAEAVLEAAEATAMVRDWGGTKDDRVAIAKAQRMNDPEVVERKQEVANRYAYRKLVGVLFINVERNAALVSRELTRRTGSYEAKPRRESRWRA